MRQDLTLGDPGAVVLYSFSLKKEMSDDFCQNLEPAVRQGLIFPLPLAGDNPTNVRLVLNEALQEAEEAQWLGKYEWQLKIPDGQLMLDGGCDGDELDPDLLGDLYHLIEIPPGDYGLTLYGYITSPNAIDCLEAAGLGESWVDWFSRTRPGLDYPAWLLENEDYEQYRRLAVAERHREYVDFLIHLMPLEVAPPSLPDLIEQGWLPYVHNPRLPEQCPLGLPFQGATEAYDPESSPELSFQVAPSATVGFDIDQLPDSSDWEDNYRQMVRDEVEAHLQEMGDEARQAYLQSLLDKLAGPYPDDQFEAAIRLGIIGQPALPLVLDIIQTEQNPDLRAGAVQALGEFDDDIALTTVCHIAKSRDEDQKVRVLAIWILGDSSDQRAYETLITASTDDDWWLRDRAIRSLAGRDNSEVIERFIAALSDPMQPVQETAANALQQINTPKAITALKTWQAKKEQS